MVNNWKELNKLWEEYFHLSVYKNEHLIKPILHYWLGICFTKKHKLLLGGHYKTLRIHPFIIQQSGSGKSVGMKSAFFLLKHLGADVLYTTSTTDSALTGSISLSNSGKKIKMEGLLSYKDGIIWDEGSMLFKNNSFSVNLADILQMTMDDPGYITRALKPGVVEFRTNTSIMAGSYIEENIEKGLLKRGLLQRMLVIFRRYSQIELLDFLKNKFKLVANENKELETLSNSIEQLLPKPEKNMIITLDPEDYEKFCDMFSKFLEERLDSYKDVKQEVLGSFFSRNDQLIIMAAHKAILEGRSVVKKEDFMYGFEIYKQHLRSINELLLMQTSSDKSAMDVKAEFIKRMLTTREYGICELRDELVKFPNWELGKLNTYNLINKLIEQNKISFRVEDHGKKILTL